MADPSIGNGTVEIEISSPLLRKGLVIRTWVSENYAENATRAMINIARLINVNSKEK